MLESQRIYWNSSEMYIHTINSVGNKSTTYNSILTYAVVSFRFGLKRTPLSAIPQQVRKFVQIYLSSDDNRIPSKNLSLNLLIPGSRHTAGLRRRWDLQNYRGNRTTIGIFTSGSLARQASFISTPNSTIKSHLSLRLKWDDEFPQGKVVPMASTCQPGQ